jgi:hypothetical protein
MTLIAFGFPTFKKGHAKQCRRHLLSMPKIEIKNKINGDKTTFYISKALNAHISR